MISSKTKMKVYRSLLFILLLVFVSCSKHKDTNFKVEGILENLSTDTIYAVKEFSQDSLVIDTLTIKKNGHFEIDGSVLNPTTISLFYSDSFPPIRFFVDKDYSVKIGGDALSPSLIEIKGGDINDDIQNFKKNNKTLLQARDRAFSKREHFDPTELRNIDIQLAQSVRDYVKSNPTRLASVILMNEFSIGNITPEALGEDIESLKGQASEFYMASSLKDYYQRVRSSMNGAVAPEIKLKNTKGKEVKLSDYRGKAVLLVFDLKESSSNENYFRKLKESQQKLKNKIDFISIVIDEDSETPDPEIVKVANSLDWQVLLDSKKWNSKEIKNYNITSAPYMILISPDGTISERDISLDSLVLRYNIEK